MNQDMTNKTIKFQQKEWHIKDRMGKGGFGSVYRARSANGEPVVVKFIPQSLGAERELLFEDLEGLSNVVPVLERGEWSGMWVLVMPEAEKSLRDYLSEMGGHLSGDDAVQVLRDIADALVAIENRVVHRDIKPENVLLLNGTWCLADFGISRYAEATTAPDTRKHAMTPPYAAPEQWRGERASSATDVYATGVVAYELLAGRLPFTGDDYRRQHMEVTPEPISGIPLKLRSLIDECLYKAPQARPNPQNLLTRLQEVAQPDSEAARQLQQANVLVVHQQAEAARQQSIAQSEEERRVALSQAAEQSLDRVIGLLHHQIVANAPASVSPGNQSSWSWALNEAELKVEPSCMIELAPRVGSNATPFDLVSYSSITIRTRPESHGYEGRSHSLWYCDAVDVGVFRWYETAFMFNPSINKRCRLEPFALHPGRKANEALAPVMSTIQVAWPFTPIDQGDEREFIERWMKWFADAAQGNLHSPRQMPERDPHGSWRR